MNKDIIQFSHANGFPGSTYASLFQALEDEYEIHFIDTLGHTSQYPVTNNWKLLVKELINEIETSTLKKNKDHHTSVIGMGHSLGAAITLFAAIERPELFKALVLLEVPLFSLPKAIMVRLLKKINRIDWITPGVHAKRRRNHFNSKEEALDYFRTRPLYKNFSESSLEDFVNHGMVSRNNHWELKFNPKVEAEIYQTLPHDYADYKQKLKCPSVAIIGKDTDILHGIDIHYMEKHFGIIVKKISGGHLFPFEHPELTAQVVKESLHELLGKG